MYDHEWVSPEGTKVPVSKMSLPDIINCLNNGIHVIDTTPAGDILERLRIEILIRQLGL